MTKTITAEIRLNKSISDWRLTETVSRSAERYFVGKLPDSLRTVDKRLYELTVFTDSTAEGKPVRGSCTVTIHPGSSRAEIAATVARAASAASRVKNRYIELPAPSATAVAGLPSSAFEGKSPESAMDALCEALYAPDGEAGSSINSLEVFLTRTETRILNSRGLDVFFSGWNGMGEFAVNASETGKSEIELCDRIDFSEPDYPRLTGAVRGLLRQAADRLRAVPTPDCSGLPVLLREDLAASLYGYWFGTVQARAVFEKRSPFSLGDNVAGEGMSGDRIDLSALPAIAGSPLSRPYDADGIALAPLHCIEGNVLERVTGPSAYTQYLGLSEVGAHPVFELSGGRASVSELEAEPHLEAAAFSDFYVDTSTGDFGGELRLGYRVEGKNRIPVTGGSVTGNMTENRGSIRLSSERSATASCLAPSACLVPRVRISPAG